VTTIIARRSQFHQIALGDHVNPYNVLFRETLNGLTQQLNHAGLSLPDAQRQALARIYVGLQAQAATLSYIDTYWILSICCACMFLLSFALVRNDPRPGSTVALH
jgi:DHA2 family multidrug resistance protein